LHVVDPVEVPAGADGGDAVRFEAVAAEGPPGRRRRVRRATPGRTGAALGADLHAQAARLAIGYQRVSTTEPVAPVLGAFLRGKRRRRGR
jgi:hypothetical protein